MRERDREYEVNFFIQGQKKRELYRKQLVYTYWQDSITEFLVSHTSTFAHDLIDQACMGEKGKYHVIPSQKNKY